MYCDTSLALFPDDEAGGEISRPNHGFLEAGSLTLLSEFATRQEECHATSQQLFSLRKIPRQGTLAPMNILERFESLLDIVSDDDDNDYDSEVEDDDVHMTLKQRIPARLMSAQMQHGPLLWTTQRSVELQQVVDSFNLTDLKNVRLPLQVKLCDIKFSVTIADPMQYDCPVVACSSGFTDLTGYTLPEVCGQNCRFLLSGVPADRIDRQSRYHASNFCKGVQKGDKCDSRFVLPPGVKQYGTPLEDEGEIICVQTNARKDGELFKNMFLLKQVSLDDQPFIIALQAGFADEYEDPAKNQELEIKCQVAWKLLGDNMCKLREVFCSGFWDQATMHSQWASHISP